MPFTRPTLTALQAQVATDITTYLPQGAAPLLRYNNLGIIGRVQARLTSGLYGRLDFIALQGTPWSATDPAIQAAWGALRGVTQKTAVAASGVVPVVGTNGTVVPAGTVLTRGDGATFTTTSAAVVANGVASCPVTAAAGAAGNTAVGAGLMLSAPIAGVSSAVTLTTAIAGGLDAETPAAFRIRYLAAYAAPPQSGSRDDYVRWATALPQVTRAWVRPGAVGTGSITVYAMLDVLNAAQGGFPQGANGVAATEPRGVAATGDQLAIANALVVLQPAEALVYVCSPVPQAFNLTIAGMPPALQPLVAPAIQALLTAEATPGGVYLASGLTSGVMPLQRVWSAIFAATGTASFQIVAPITDLTVGVGQIATLGTVTFQ